MFSPGFSFDPLAGPHRE